MPRNENMSFKLVRSALANLKRLGSPDAIAAVLLRRHNIRQTARTLAMLKRARSLST
jgi:hypothetical protein